MTPAEEYFVTLGVSPEHARRAVKRTPRLASLTEPSTTAEPVITYLKSLDLTPKQIARAIQHAPHMIFRPVTTFATRLTFLKDFACISGKFIPNVVARCPHVLWMDLDDAEELVSVVRNKCPALTDDALGSVFARVPQVLIKEPRRVTQNLSTLRNAGVGEASMGRVVAKSPLALVYDELSFTKRIDFLRGIGLSNEIVGRVLVATPEVLQMSVEKALQPRVELLQSLVGDDAIVEIIDKVPGLFGVDGILDRVLWLRDVVKLDDKQIKHVLREAPAVMTYSVEGNLQQKWEFIHGTLGATMDDVVKLPRETLCANLQQRAMPRYAFLASSGMHDIPVVDILKGSDAEFCREVALCKPSTFRRFVDNDTYLLFFSTLM